MGFLEYGSALRNFDQLLKTATSEELKAIDEIVESLPQFTVYTNLSRRIRRAPSSLAEQPESSDDRFRQRGFAPVVALARAELGGILATFTSHPAPFEVVGPTPYELAAYKELLLDGAQTHYLALLNDPQARLVARKIPDTQTLAYIRRVTEARHFLIAAVRGLLPKLSPLQIEESMSQKRNLEDIASAYTSSVAEYVASQNYSKSSTQSTTSTSSVVEACRRQLRNEPKALALGTARVTQQ